MLKSAKVIALLVALSGCGYVDAYEEAVYDREPLYCYQSLGTVQCFKEPQHHDERRLVNYFGPHPSRYDPPDPPDVPDLEAPEEIDHWVKDPEPVPKPAVRMQDLPKPKKAETAVPSGAQSSLGHEMAPAATVHEVNQPLEEVVSTLQGEI
jgi:hypothetical protein